MKAYIIKNKNGEYLTHLDQSIQFLSNPSPHMIDLFETEEFVSEFMAQFHPNVEFDVFEFDIP